VVHADIEVKVSMMWDTARGDVPVLIAQLDTILASDTA
jgi:uncharacterized protein with HEPN domain